MVVLRGGTVIDGSGSPGRRADVVLDGERIVAIEPSVAGDAPAIDCRGLVVAPGFIDVHNHSEGWLLKQPHQVAKTTQGITTEVLMSDGISYAPLSADHRRDWLYYLKTLDGLDLADDCGWESIAEYLALLDRRVAQNVIAQVPYANVRVLACGWRRVVPDDTQLRHMQLEIRRGLDEGAVGVSTGLDYVNQSLSTTDELAEACQVLREYDGLYVTHVRYKKGLLPGLREAVEIGRRAGCKVHISHLKAPSRAELEPLLEFLDREASPQVDLSFDLYPYMPGSTMLSYFLPYEVWESGPTGALRQLTRPDIRRQLAAFFHSRQAPALEQVYFAWLGSQVGRAWQGRTLADYVAATGLDVGDAICDLLIEENLRVLMVVRLEDDTLVEPLWQHPRAMFGSDGIDQPGAAVHPRQFGSAPRVLGHLVRERRALSLESAVHKLSGWPAERFGLRERGVLRPGAFADVVAFDPATINDRATYDDPRQCSTGVRHVWVNGTPIIVDGTPRDDFPQGWPGRALRYQPAG